MYAPDPENELRDLAKKINNIRPVDVVIRALPSISDNQVKRTLCTYAEQCNLFRIDKLLSKHTNLSYWEWKRIAIDDILRLLTDNTDVIRNVSKKIVNINARDILEKARLLFDTKTMKKVDKAVKKDGLAFLPTILNDIEPGMYERWLIILTKRIIKEGLHEKTYQEATK